MLVEWILYTHRVLNIPLGITNSAILSARHRYLQICRQYDTMSTSNKVKTSRCGNCGNTGHRKNMKECPQYYKYLQSRRVAKQSVPSTAAVFEMVTPPLLPSEIHDDMKVGVTQTDEEEGDELSEDSESTISEFEDSDDDSNTLLTKPRRKRALPGNSAALRMTVKKQRITPSIEACCMAVADQESLYRKFEQIRNHVNKSLGTLRKNSARYTRVHTLLSNNQKVVQNLTSKLQGEKDLGISLQNDFKLLYNNTNWSQMNNYERVQHSERKFKQAKALHHQLKNIEARQNKYTRQLKRRVEARKKYKSEMSTLTQESDSILQELQNPVFQALSTCEM